MISLSASACLAPAIRETEATVPWMNARRPSGVVAAGVRSALAAKVQRLRMGVNRSFPVFLRYFHMKKTVSREIVFFRQNPSSQAACDIPIAHLRGVYDFRDFDEAVQLI